MRSQWNWARALVKEQKMRAKDGEWDDLLDAHILQALWREQRGHCALTGMIMVRPQPAALGARTTLTQWRAAQFASVAARSPALLRISRTGAWTPGNVVLVAHGAAALPDVCGGIHECRVAGRNLAQGDITVPQRERLLRGARKAVDQEYERWRRST